ncbi:LOW QUALITY PROTEIN: hypothetical protein CFOL_v3_18764, partial [Cephalotus follicularis]
EESDQTISPTYSEMKPPSQFMMIKIDRPFEIDKDLIRKYFLLKRNIQNRNNFFSKYIATEQNDIRKAWYKYMAKIKAHVMFFDYLPSYINQQENRKKMNEDKQILLNKKSTTTWVITDNKIMEAIHPPSEKIQLNFQNNKKQVASFKLQAENSTVPVSVNETNKIIEQNNYTNRHLQTVGSQLSRIETLIHKTSDTKTKPQTSKPLFTPYTIPQSQARQLTLNEVNQRLQSLIIPETPSLSTPQKEPKNKMQINVIQEEDQVSDNSIQKTTNKLGKFVQVSYKSSSIYEWNIDDMNEYHIINKLQEMTMINTCNAYNIKNSSDKVVANLLIAGFTGQLKGWDNVLTIQQQTEILDSIQTDEIGEPILDLNNEPIEDSVATLIYNITKHFIG